MFTWLKSQYYRVSKMNIFVLFVILGCCETAYSRVPHGRKTYTNFNKYGSDLKEISKYREVFSKDMVTPLITTHSLEPSNDYSYKSFNSKRDNVKPTIDKIHPNEIFKEDQSLSMEIGNNIIKVSSVSHSEKESGFKKPLLSSSKFHHVIEVIPIVKESKLPETVSTIQSLIKFVQTDVQTDSTVLTGNISEIAHTPEHNFENASFTQEVVDEALNSGREASSFPDELESSGEEMFNSTDFESDANNEKSGRLLGFFSRLNDSSPVCTTPKNETGRCRRFRHCLLIDALDNFNLFLQYLCLIRGAAVGICCPDNPVVEIINSDVSTQSDSDRDIKQPPEGCGLNVKTRIVGGSISVPHEWSWMVALMRRNRFYCGGVIINNWYILTAAHCVLGINVKDLTIRLGEYNFGIQNEHEEDLSVAEIKRHAQFVTLTFQHDVALLKLQRSINYTKFVGSICLPMQTSRDYTDAKGTVVGWGTVSFGGAASPILRQVTVPVWKNEDCDRTYVLENISEAFMCAGSPEKGEDACQGDSGGPLMTLNDRGRWEVIGIVSWGRRCGDPTYPGVYTRITTYLDWITQNAT